MVMIGVEKMRGGFGVDLGGEVGGEVEGMVKGGVEWLVGWGKMNVGGISGHKNRG